MLAHQFDFDGEPIDFWEWCELFASPERVVAYDVLDDVEVSTVWLGIDYTFGLDERAPRIYETMIFGGELDQVGERYPNRVAAQAGHDQWVAAVRECGAVRQ